MQKSAFKKAGTFFSTILIITLYLALTAANYSGKSNLVAVISPATTMLPVNTENISFTEKVNALYDSMHLDLMGLSKQTFDYAMKGFNNLVRSGRLENENVISIVDFSLPSYKKRLFVIDLSEARVVFNTYVAHGVNSGAAMASDFSNKPQSNKSSLGFYETLSTYLGGHGYSLRLEGLEKGINDNANRRDIVIHGAGYVNEDLIRSQGYIGRSWGCPALPENLYKPIINKIKDGTCLFIYSPNKNYLSKSKIINA